MGQGAYILEVWELFRSSLNYKGDPESFSKNKKALPEIEPCEEHDQHGTLSPILGALMWIAFRTRPDICWAVTRGSQAVRANELAEDVQQRAR
eukprot:8463825-Prorocentrum_lima.AAC.1